jgi:hypothetical protein
MSLQLQPPMRYETPEAKCGGGPAQYYRLQRPTTTAFDRL